MQRQKRAQAEVQRNSRTYNSPCPKTQAPMRVCDPRPSCARHPASCKCSPYTYCSSSLTLPCPQPLCPSRAHDPRSSPVHTASPSCTQRLTILCTCPLTKRMGTGYSSHSLLYPAPHHPVHMSLDHADGYRVLLTQPLVPRASPSCAHVP